MNTFLPYADFDQSAKILDSLRLNSCINEALVILRSHTHVYAKKKTGICGWEKHTVALFWKGYEYHLIQYALALAKEWLARYRTLQDVAIFNARKERLRQWKALNELAEDLELEQTMPPLIGDEDFHKGMRAFLLFKDCQKQTFLNWKQGIYPNHAVTIDLLPRKSSWKREHYLNIWDTFGRPDPVWYGQWNWDEEPNDLLLFYSLDKKSQIEKEEERKRLRPMVSYYLKYAKHRTSSSTTSEAIDCQQDN